MTALRQMYITMCFEFCTFLCLQVQKSVCDVSAVVFPILSVLRLNKNLYRYQNGTKFKVAICSHWAPNLAPCALPGVLKFCTIPGASNLVHCYPKWMKKFMFSPKLTFIYPIISKISNVQCRYINRISNYGFTFTIFSIMVFIAVAGGPIIWFSFRITVNY